MLYELSSPQLDFWGGTFEMKEKQVSNLACVWPHFPQCWGCCGLMPRWWAWCPVFCSSSSSTTPSWSQQCHLPWLWTTRWPLDSHCASYQCSEVLTSFALAGVVLGMWSAAITATPLLHLLKHWGTFLCLLSSTGHDLLGLLWCVFQQTLWAGHHHAGHVL
jgi:hypothetical protein